MKQSTDTIFNSNLETKKIPQHFLNVSSVVFWTLKQSECLQHHTYVIEGQQIFYYLLRRPSVCYEEKDVAETLYKELVYLVFKTRT